MDQLINKVICIVLLLLAITGCSVIPERPTSKEPINHTQVETSTIAVDLKVPLGVIEGAINQAVPSQLYWTTGHPMNNCPVSSCSYQVRVIRTGNIGVGQDSSGRLVLSIPIGITDGRVDAMQNVLGAHVRITGSVGANVIGTAAVTFDLDPEWNVIPSASVSFNVQSAIANIKVIGGSVNVSIQGVMQSALNSKRDEIQSSINNALRGKFNFKYDAEKAWKTLYAVEKLYDEPPLWLKSAPTALKVQNPRTKGGALHVVMGIDAKLSTHAQDREPEMPEVKPLPPLSVVSSIHGEYKLRVPLCISVADITKRLSVLEGKEFTFKGKDKTIKATLRKAYVYTNGPDVVAYVEVRVDNHILGFVPLDVGAYINGTPQYSTDSRTLRVDPFDYDVDTNNVLLDEAEWFFHGMIREKLQETLRMSIGDELDDAQVKLANKLRELPVGESTVIRASVDQLGPRAIYATQNEVNIDLFASGALNAEIKDTSRDVAVVP